MTRKVYVSATDAKGAPVTDLTAAEITVKEGGKERPVASLQPAVAPMQVAILVDDAGTGAFQGAVAQFLQKAFGRGQFSISLLSPQAVKIVDFTEDADELKNALGKLGARGRLQPDGDQMPRGDCGSRKDVPAGEGPAAGHRGADDCRRPASLDRAGQRARRAPIRAAQALNVVHVMGADLGQIMGDGPKQSGGRIEQAGTGPAFARGGDQNCGRAPGPVPLTYTLPDGVKMSDRLNVTTSRKGITLTRRRVSRTK